MPEAAQRRDVVLQDGPSTAAALGSKHVEVVLPAVGLPVLLMEACTGPQTPLLTSSLTNHQLVSHLKKKNLTAL